MLETELDVNRKVIGATLLLTFFNLASRPHSAQQIVAMSEPLLKRPGVTPLNRIWWCNRLTYFLNARGDHQAVRVLTQEVRDIIETHGLKGLNSAAVLDEWHLGWAVMAMKQWDEANRVVQRLEQLVRKSRPSDLLLLTGAKFRLAMGRGDIAVAVREAPTAVAAANAVGMIYMQAMQLASSVEVYAEAGLHTEARAQAALAYDLVRGTCFEYMATEIRVSEAYLEQREGNAERCHELLREVFSPAARLQPNWINAGLSGRVLAAMCAEALDAGIEVAYAKSLIRRFRLAPAVLNREIWPWRAKVYTMGRFELWCDDERVQFAGKAPKKPLGLLKALIALGGRNIPEERLMDALWPDEEADAARKSLDITVLRLRKLLGTNEAIIVSNEEIGLNPQVCWTDVWVLERQLDLCEAGHGRVDAAAEAMRLYRGVFLPSETNVPWTAKTRERLRTRIVRVVEAAALAEEEAGRLYQAIELYTKGLDADELIEPFYQGLMRCYRRLGRYAEAMNTFRRLRQLLSVVLGIAPSESTREMARALQRDNPAQFESSRIGRDGG